MGAVEHLKTLCCLGLKPESAMIAVTPLLHEIIPHGWSRMGLYESDATIMIHRAFLAPYTYLSLGPPESAGLCIGRGGVGWIATGTGK
jgi:hypothetical protein